MQHSFFSLFLIVHLNYDLVYCPPPPSKTENFHFLLKENHTVHLDSFGFAHFGTFHRVVDLSLECLCGPSLQGYAPEQSRKKKKKGKGEFSENWDDQKPTICAKVGIKFCDNLKIKVGD